MKLLPLYTNCLLKSDALSGGADVGCDDRAYLMHSLGMIHWTWNFFTHSSSISLGSMDVSSTVAYFYPRLIPLHDLPEGPVSYFNKCINLWILLTYGKFNFMTECGNSPSASLLHGKSYRQWRILAGKWNLYVYVHWVNCWSRLGPGCFRSSSNFYLSIFLMLDTNKQTATLKGKLSDQLGKVEAWRARQSDLRGCSQSHWTYS